MVFQVSLEAGTQQALDNNKGAPIFFTCVPNLGLISPSFFLYTLVSEVRFTESQGQVQIALYSASTTVQLHNQKFVHEIPVKKKWEHRAIEIK